MSMGVSVNHILVLKPGIVFLTIGNSNSWRFILSVAQKTWPPYSVDDADSVGQRMVLDFLSHV